MDTQTQQKNDLIMLVKSLYKEINKISNTYLQYDDINVSQRAILEVLLEDSFTVPQIAKQHNVSRQHIQTNVNNLIEKGFVISEKNSAHKRSNLITLTKEGHSLFQEIKDFEQRLMTDLFNDISSKQIQNTNGILKTMHTKAQAISEAIK